MSVIPSLDLGIDVRWHSSCCSKVSRRYSSCFLAVHHYRARVLVLDERRRLAKFGLSNLDGLNASFGLHWLSNLPHYVRWALAIHTGACNGPMEATQLWLAHHLMLTVFTWPSSHTSMLIVHYRWVIRQRKARCMPRLSQANSRPWIILLRCRYTLVLCFRFLQAGISQIMPISISKLKRTYLIRDLSIDHWIAPMPPDTILCSVPTSKNLRSPSSMTILLLTS